MLEGRDRDANNSGTSAARVEGGIVAKYGLVSSSCVSFEPTGRGLTRGGKVLESKVSETTKSRQFMFLEFRQDPKAGSVGRRRGTGKRKTSNGGTWMSAV